MHAFKFVFAFLSVGGATYAFIKLNEAPLWLKLVSGVMAVAALIIALPELPRAVEAIKETADKVVAMLPSRPAPATAPSIQYQPQIATPPAPTYTAPTPIRAPTPAIYTPPPQPYPPAAAPTPKCAALVMGTRGGWGASSGTGLTCVERVDRARNTCTAHVSTGDCGNYASGRGWVAGVHCNAPIATGRKWNSFAASGDSEPEAFQRAFAVATSRGFDPSNCRRIVAISADGGQPRRYT
jgi:hypothetical protein